MRIEAPSLKYSGLDQGILGPPTSIITSGAVREEKEVSDKSMNR